MAQPSNIFICHASGDDRSVRSLVHCVGPTLSAQRPDLQLWDDKDKLRAGQQWHPTIATAMRQSRAAVVVVSFQLFNSSYVMREELPRLLKRAKQGSLRLMCLYADNSLADQYPFTVQIGKHQHQMVLPDLQGLNSPSRPIESIQSSRARNRAWEDVARKLLGSLKDLPKPQGGR